MNVADEIRDQLREHGPDVGRAILRHLPDIIRWFRDRKFDKHAITADFERLTRDAKAEYEAGHARLVAEAERERIRDAGES